MAASPKRVSARRAQLGAPVLPVSSPGRYLRHRVAADRAYHLRRRLLWWHRAALLVIASLFYLVIGRDLIALARAKKDSAAMEIRHDTHQIATDLSRIAASARLASDQSIPGLDPSPLPASGTVEPGDLDSLLSKQPVELRSRARQPDDEPLF